MSESKSQQPASDVVDDNLSSAKGAAPAKIDFKKYRTPELVGHITELIDVRGMLVSGFVLAFLCTLFVAGALGAFALLRRDEIGWLGFGIMVLMGVEAGGITGVFFAIASVIRRSFANMLGIVQLMLETTQQIAKDVRAVRSGDAEMPTAKEMTRGAYLDLFLPTIEKVISDQLGFLGTPLLFVYRLTFGKLVRAVIHVMPEKGLEKLQGENLEKSKAETMKRMEAIADKEDSIVAVLKWTQTKIAGMGDALRKIVMTPCHVICGVVVFFHIIVVFVVYWIVVWTMSGVAEPDAAVSLLM